MGGSNYDNYFAGGLTVGGDIECTDCIDSGEIADGAVGASEIADGAVGFVCNNSGQNTVIIPPSTIDYVYGNTCASGYIPIGVDCLAGYADLRLTTSRIVTGKGQCRFYNLGGSNREVKAATRCCKLTM
jgi:hypothetical protein